MITLHSSSRKQLLLQLLNKRNRAQHPISKGFTLIELLVVIVILGVLGAVGYQAYLNQIQRANQATAQIVATAAAKNCAALRITSEEGDWVAGITDPTQVELNQTVCNATGPQTFTATVGSGGGNVATFSAQVTSTGAVVNVP